MRRRMGSLLRDNGQSSEIAKCYGIAERVEKRRLKKFFKEIEKLRREGDKEGLSHVFTVNNERSEHDQISRKIARKASQALTSLR